MPAMRPAKAGDQGKAKTSGVVMLIGGMVSSTLLMC
jgi:hypothetical protein